ncbi:aminodeoxychorismate synthase component I [Alteribacter lacisalsi]|uniref:Aminodeoxychorismate synthase component I n=1 Tax=Alteribacter lacisalsi TaxID=2045244 RepID=A0A2W0HF36_9BACI|nr:anthranilate synthase component I family protein [Alteribacter lacisalsi]PYZ95409.1 aminodeoxychorismate synthase component I [Alteribacter lacisalsi]
MGMKRRAAGRVRPLKENRQHWFTTFTSLAEKSSEYILLESGRGGRYSIMGMNPWAEIKGKDDTLTVKHDGSVTRFSGPLLKSLEEWLLPFRTEKMPDLPDCQGGLFGSISYDLIRQIEVIPEEAADDLYTPDLHFLAFDDLYVIDHKSEAFWILTHVSEEGTDRDAQAKLDALDEAWQSAEKEDSRWFRHSPERHRDEEPIRSLSEPEFMKAVDQVKDYIAQGDVFQVNLSVRETRPLLTHPLHVYECLREFNPSPYMGYFHTKDVQQVSASPELLVKVKGEEVSTRPIAGTRSRGRDEAEDQKLADTLINNQKERAEHVMLVDLERNDLGRVSRYGTVEVDELMVIEKYSHVMHIVSNVRGELAPGNSEFDVIAATFPGGTITGAPKIRTMEIIEELEPVRRGIYTGSLGWIGFNGDMELNIAIRTMLVEAGHAHVQAGAGIVIDSDPAAEYKECLKKARALWKAKEMSEDETKQS